MLQRPQVAWPDLSWELLSWTKLLTMDLEFMKPDCVVPLPFFTKWVAKFFFPFGLFVIVAFATLYVRVKMKRNGQEFPDRLDRPTLSGAFLFVLAMCIHVMLIWHLKVVLSPVDCDWCREGVMCLDEYTLVECWSGDKTWTTMMIMSSIDFCFLSGAFPLFLTVRIWLAWRNDTASRFSISTQTADSVSFTSFFSTGYKRREHGGTILTYGWEVLILFRKFLLIIAAKFTTRHAVRGANLQLLILFVFLLGQLTLRPYKDGILNSLDGVLNSLQFLTLLSACQLTMGVGETLRHFYVGLNVATLFGGALLAWTVCVRKLSMAWVEQQEADRDNSYQKDGAEGPGEDEHNGRVEKEGKIDHAHMRYTGL